MLLFTFSKKYFGSEKALCHYILSGLLSCEDGALQVLISSVHLYLIIKLNFKASLEFLKVL